VARKEVEKREVNIVKNRVIISKTWWLVTFGKSPLACSCTKISLGARRIWLLFLLSPSHTCLWSLFSNTCFPPLVLSTLHFGDFYLHCWSLASFFCQGSSCLFFWFPILYLLLLIPSGLRLHVTSVEFFWTSWTVELPDLANKIITKQTTNTTKNRMPNSI